MFTRSLIVFSAVLATSGTGAHAATMSVRAVARNGTPIPATGNVAVAPGDTLTVEVRLTNWAADLPGGGLRVFEAYVNNLQTATSGDSGAVVPLGWDAPLSPTACQSALGCSSPYSVCDAVCRRCVGADHDVSVGVAVECGAPDHVFAGLDAICDAGGLCTLVARRLFGVVEEGGVQDPGGGYRALLGTLMLQVSDDACGVFALDLEPFPKTYISGTNLAPVSVSRSPLMITIAAGAEDCNANALPDSCDVIAGSSPDENGNELPDECDLDLDKDRDADLRDAAAMINCFGNATPACAGANFHPSPAINLADWAAMATSMNGPGPSSD